MAHVEMMINQLKRSGKYSVFIVAGLLLFIWGLETPAGILGKADAVGYAFCHRIDLRSFHIGIRQLPLCARCTGQYVGAMIGLLFQAGVARRRSGFPPRHILVILALLGLAYAVDGLNSYLYLPPFLDAFPAMPHLYSPSNALRLITGTGMGLVLAIVLYPAFVGSIFAQPDIRQSLGGLKPLFAMIGLGILADVLILQGSMYILFPAALISTGGVIILLSLAYTTAILRILKKENSYTSLSQISLPLSMGFLLTMSQIALFDLIRFIITGTWSGLGFG